MRPIGGPVHVAGDPVCNRGWADDRRPGIAVRERARNGRGYTGQLH